LADSDDVDEAAPSLSLSSFSMRGRERSAHLFPHQPKSCSTPDPLSKRRDEKGRTRREERSVSVSDLGASSPGFPLLLLP